jgi:hypothetical protein
MSTTGGSLRASTPTNPERACPQPIDRLGKLVGAAMATAGVCGPRLRWSWPDGFTGKRDSQRSL